MSIKQLVAELMKREGGKKQVNRAQMSEVIGHISDIVYLMEMDAMSALYNNGKRRAKRKAKIGQNVRVKK